METKIRWGRIFANAIIISSWLFGLGIILFLDPDSAKGKIDALSALVDKIFPSLSILMGGIVGTSVVEKVGDIVRDVKGPRNG